jgi:hypothetical protein
MGCECLRTGCWGQPRNEIFITCMPASSSPNSIKLTNEEETISMRENKTNRNPEGNGSLATPRLNVRTLK